MAKRQDFRELVESFRELCHREAPERVAAAAREVLADPHGLLVARAAELAGDRLIYGLEPDLITAYRRFPDDPVRRDPGCPAKGATDYHRALIQLVDLCHDPEPHARGGPTSQRSGPRLVGGGRGDL